LGRTAAGRTYFLQNGRAFTDFFRESACIPLELFFDFSAKETVPGQF